MSIDYDPQETKEWLAALDNLVEYQNISRAEAILQFSANYLKDRHQSNWRFALNTPYKNTIAAKDEAQMPDYGEIKYKANAMICWHAVAMVVKANRKSSELGGHLSTGVSASQLYEIGFEHFFHGRNEQHLGDMVFFQGHASPIIYARAYMEGRITKDQMTLFRQETPPKKGLSSYPHPWLMPNFWQFPTVSMGLGMMQAIYHARFMQYLTHRALLPPSNRKVWVFCGDGEMDEPESLGALTVAGREKLDSLIVVINCNLQRLDGPVRGNGKIIQELEAVFHGAGWQVIKSIWDTHWDTLFAKDPNNVLESVLNEMVDGQFQEMARKDAAFIRKLIFEKHPSLHKLVADWDDQQIESLGRAGHDRQKIYAAYHKAYHHKGQPTVILIKSIKGYGLGPLAAAANTAHNQKKLPDEALIAYAKFLELPISDAQACDTEFFEDDKATDYLKSRRAQLGGFIPKRHSNNKALDLPPLSCLKPLLDSSGERSVSTTMAFVRTLSLLLRENNIKDLIVPIVPDESRTFGMEGLFRQIGIYAPEGQKYEPVDRNQVMYYREDKKGQYLQEGINEGGAMCSWIAAATSYSEHNLPLIPFYIYYSMFGFQRIGDFAWAAGDSRARGFLIGATAGRTTLAGEGLQHQDGHSHVLASTIPNCVAYDPTFAYELAVIIHHGIDDMMVKQRDVFYYLTVTNENYTHPAMPKGVESGIIAGMYCFEKANNPKASLQVQLLGSGTIFREVLAAAQLLKEDFQVESQVWSVTSFNELRRQGLEVARQNQLRPDQPAKTTYVADCLSATQGPVIAATDSMRLYADQIREFVPGDYWVLGTDGFGRSDTRAALRAFFEVDAKSIAYQALVALHHQKKIKTTVLMQAQKKYQILDDKPAPWTV